MHLAMFYCPLFAALALLMQSLIVQGASDPVIIERRSAADAPLNHMPSRRLIAARSASRLEARRAGLDNLLKSEHVLPFIDDTSAAISTGKTKSGLESPFAAHVRLKSFLPTFLLEEHEDLLEHISCSGTTIEVAFQDASVLSTIWTEVQQHRELLVITSHHGCNAAGERDPYLVTKTQKEGRTLVFSVVSASWRKAFHSIDIGFGGHEDSTRLERHDQLLKKRQDLTTSAAAESSTSFSFPPAPTSTPTATQIAAASVTTAWTDTTILPPSFPGSDFLVPDLPAGLNVKCKNCTLRGSLDLTQGSVNLNNANETDFTDVFDIISPSIDDTIDFFQEGYIELTVRELIAHIELESTVQPSAELITYIAPFPDIGIPGWVIPKIAEVGPILRPQIEFGVQLSTELEFTYGFDLVVPSNSTIHLDIGDLISNSTAKGFQDTKFTPIPFQSEMNSLNLTVSAAFNPQILLTVSVLDHDDEIAAGAFLDLPKLSATVAQVKDVDEKCNPANKSSGGSIKAFFDDSLTNIVPKVEFGVGVLAEGSIDLPGLEKEFEAATTLLSTEYPLPTACISYDGKAKTYAAAATAKETKKESAGVSMKGPSLILLLSPALFVAWGVLLL